MKISTFVFVITAICMLSIALFSSPALAKMICCGGTNPGTNCSSDTTCDGGKCGGLCNPLGSNTMKLTDLFIRIAQIALGFTGLFGVVMFIYGGMTLLTSAGNPEKVKKAKDTLVWAVAGIALILLSGIIVNYVFKNFSFF